jgi:antitoxin component of MazEF toxin-antitoxin module
MLTMNKRLCKNAQGYLFLFIPRLFQKELSLNAGDVVKVELKRNKLIMTITKKTPEVSNPQK